MTLMYSHKDQKTNKNMIIIVTNNVTLKIFIKFKEIIHVNFFLSNLL